MVTNAPGAIFRIAGGYPTAQPDVTRMDRARWPIVPRYSHSSAYLLRKAGEYFPLVSSPSPMTLLCSAHYHVLPLQ